ncbi:MAG: Type 1 glutamine amidotransferase-like domain-containing protein, partial [Blastocatellia bacterium]|nr:Type 1 glutamine amidotransferase-like domain-containing protein [Blastocatellia bacterium]
QAKNYQVASRADANSSAISEIQNADVIFIKGGDQGQYYDDWNETLLESHIRTVVQTRNGAIGGTSAGAMSLAEYSFSGGQDMISSDVLADSHSSFLNDASLSGTSGIHTDFFSFIDNVVVDTHYTQRGRLGRLLGLLGKSVQDFGTREILAVGLEQKTGLFIKNGVAEVIGVGAIDFIKESSNSTLSRIPGRPLFYTNLVLDRLTHGWKYNLATRSVNTTALPSGTLAVTYPGDGSSNSGSLSIVGATEADNSKFNYRVTYYPSNYSLSATTATTFIRNAIGFTDSGNSTTRPDKQENIFRALYDRTGDIGFLVFAGSSVTRTATNPDIVSFSKSSTNSEVATIVIDGKTVTHKGLSPYISTYASNGGSLRAAALVNLTVHVLAESASRNRSFNTRTHEIVDTPAVTISEIESNNSLSTAQSLLSVSYPAVITGTISSSSDKDYFKVELRAGETISLSLVVPSVADYDLYFMNSRGNTLTRSVNSGRGVSESLSFTNTGSKTATYYISVESFSGSSTTSTYTLTVSK